MARSLSLFEDIHAKHIALQKKLIDHVENLTVVVTATTQQQPKSPPCCNCSSSHCDSPREEDGPETEGDGPSARQSLALNRPEVMARCLISKNIMKGARSKILDGASDDDQQLLSVVLDCSNSTEKLSTLLSRYQQQDNSTLDFA